MQDEPRDNGAFAKPKHAVRRLIQGVQDDDVIGLAAEMAYRFLFAVFPFGLFVAALGAFVANALPIDNPAAQVMSALNDNLPGPMADALAPELERLIGSPRADLLSLGAVAALWAATGGTNALIKGMHRAYDAPERRSFVKRYAVALSLTLVAAIGILVSFVTIVGGALLTEELASRIGLGDQAYALLQVLRWPAVFVLVTIAVAILYRFAPNIVVPWRWVFLGSAAFALAWLVATAAVGFYAAHFADYGATYGSLGGVIVLMLWFYVTAAVLLLGAELSAAVARTWSPGTLDQPAEAADPGAGVEGRGEGPVVERPAAPVVDRPTPRTWRRAPGQGVGPVQWLVAGLAILVPLIDLLATLLARRGGRCVGRT